MDPAEARQAEIAIDIIELWIMGPLGAVLLLLVEVIRRQTKSKLTDLIKAVNGQAAEIASVKKAIDDQGERQDRQGESLISVDRRLAHIEGKLG